MSKWALIFFTCLYCLFPSLEAQHPFFLLSIPKCGTRIVEKMLHMLAQKHPIDPAWFLKGVGGYHFYEDVPNVDKEADYLKFLNLMKRMAANNEFAVAHFNFSDFFLQFSENNPNYRAIIIVRDLRDACVSLVYYQWKEIEAAIGPSTFEEKLKWVIRGDYGVTKYSILNIRKNAREALKWKGNSHAYFIRFEDIVGPEGGGCYSAQLKTVTNVANFLGIRLCQYDLAVISHNLFGYRGPTLLNNTFRSGQIGSWKSHFDKSTEHTFKKYLGKYQNAFGYSKSH